jgi:hypothetical protein
VSLKFTLMSGMNGETMISQKILNWIVMIGFREFQNLNDPKIVSMSFRPTGEIPGQVDTKSRPVGTFGNLSLPNIAN